MLVRTEVEFSVDEDREIYINDYDGYDDLLEQCLREKKRNKKYFIGVEYVVVSGGIKFLNGFKIRIL